MKQTYRLLLHQLMVKLNTKKREKRKSKYSDCIYLIYLVIISPNFTYSNDLTQYYVWACLGIIRSPYGKLRTFFPTIYESANKQGSINLVRHL